MDVIRIQNVKSGVSIEATHMPLRKKVCLTVVKGNEQTKYATFNNDHVAEKFMEILAEFVGAKREKSKEQ